MVGKEKLLLSIQVPFRRSPEGEILVEAQAANGLARWAEHFSNIAVIAPLDQSAGSDGYVALSTLGYNAERLEVVPLPAAYRPEKFAKVLPFARRVIIEKIQGARWLCFAIGGLIGDWGSVAAVQAHSMGRKYAVWTDKVESAVTRRLAETAGGKSAIRARLTHGPMAMLERYVITRSSLGLFHGRETFDAYSKYCRQPHLVHNIHLKPNDQISESDLITKVNLAAAGSLRILYVGRVAAEKGPNDWLSAVRRIKESGVPFQARWLGDGSLMTSFREKIAAYGLNGSIEAPGQVADREEVLRHLRWANVFMFCHLTAESPRCLIEALKSAAPIIGYDSAYPRDLIAKNGGGLLTPRGDFAALATSIVKLNADRAALQKLIQAAAKDGLPFDDVSVFRHRSELIKTYS